MAAPESMPASTPAPRLRAMLDAHYGAIWRLLRRFGVSEEQLDDAAQEVFWVAARRLDAIASESEHAFLYGVALRVASDERRRKQRRLEICDDDRLARTHDAGPSPEEQIDDRRARELLDDVLDQMPHELRTVFILFELEGLEVRAIADVVGVPMGTASSRLRRAREEFSAIAKRVRAKLGFDGGGPMKRWVDETGDVFEQALLRSASRDVAPAESATKAAAALSLAAGVVAASGATAGAVAGAAAGSRVAGSIADNAVTTVIAKGTAWVAAKWVVIGALGGGALMGVLMPARAPARNQVAASARVATSPASFDGQGASGVASVATPPANEATGERQAAAGRAPSAVAAASAGDTPDSPVAARGSRERAASGAPAKQPRATAASAGASPSVPSPEVASSAASTNEQPSTLAAEIATIDTARRALASGAPSEALRLCARYASDYPRGALAPEADVVAIEAYAGLGDKHELALRGARFLARYPNNTHTSRVRRLLDGR